MRDGAISLDTAGRVLVRLPNWLGDALMARPFLAALRAAAPRARVTAQAPAVLLELLAGDRAWDEAQAWPPAAAGAAPARPDVAIVLPPSFSSARAAHASGAPVRIGYAGEFRDLLLTQARPRSARGEHHLANEYLALIDRAVPGLPAVAPLALPPAAHAQAVALRETSGLAGRSFAILAPGAVYGPAKRWAPERFARLGHALAGLGHAIAVCGTTAEAAACETVAAACGGGAVVLAGRTTLPVQAALCAAAAVVVSNDSGMAHLAGAAGAPTVAVFGSTSSAWTAPLGPRTRVVQRPPVCSPCFRRTCRIGYACLEAVGVDDVLASVVQLLETEAVA